MVIQYDSKKLEISYTHIPEEEVTLEHPSFPEDVDILRIECEGEEISDLFDDDDMMFIKSLVIAQHNKDTDDGKLEAML